MRRPSSGPGHRRTGTVATTVVVALVPLALLAGARPGFAAPDQVTITFRGSGPEPLVCTSYPEPTTVDVKVGTAVAVENRTGAMADVVVGTADPVPLADGEGLTLKLKKGIHELWLTPSCLVVQAGAATVRVGMGSGLREPGTAPPGTAAEPTAPNGRITTAAAAPPTTAAPAGESGGAASGGASGGAADGSEATDADRPVVAGAAQAATGADTTAMEGGPVLERVGPYPLPRRDDDNRGESLLAVIAAICVLGVTAGIIRAILAQQASGAAGI